HVRRQRTPPGLSRRRERPPRHRGLSHRRGIEETMVQSRLIRARFLLSISAALAAFPPSEPRGPELRSLLDDLAPAPSLKDLAAAARDYRGCDGGWNV